MPPSPLLELVCPAGTPAALDTAIEAGAHTIYCGFNDETNARNFPGLNFNRPEMRAAVQTAHRNKVKLLIAINSFAKAGQVDIWYKAIDDAAEFGADAVILADIGLLSYAKKNYPNLRLHLSVQAGASTAEAIEFYHQNFNIQRVVLPRVLSLDGISSLTKTIPIESEVFVFGGLCVMTEGKCSLSSYVTGQSPNKNGVCSPAEHIHYQETANGCLKSCLNEVTINKFSEGEAVGYPTICKGRYHFNNQLGYLFEEPTSLDLLPLLPQIAKSGVKALKIEGRQRGRAYIQKIVSTFRQAIDALEDKNIVSATSSNLTSLSEGRKSTEGAYKTTWH